MLEINPLLPFLILNPMRPTAAATATAATTVVVVLCTLLLGRLGTIGDRKVINMQRRTPAPAELVIIDIDCFILLDCALYERTD